MPAIDWTTLCIGIALCAGGWMLYWIGLHLTGALTGACLGLAVAWASVQVVLGDDPMRMWWILPIGGLVGFALGIFFIRGLHRFFFFFIGAVLGMACGQAFFDWSLTRSAWLDANRSVGRGIFLVMGSALGGLAMVYGSKWVVALVTSIIGSLLIALSIPDPLALLGVLPLAIASFFLQIGVLRRAIPAERRREPEPEED